MAWKYGTFSCGHEGRVQVYGPSVDRQRKADYYFDTHLCPECWAKKQAKLSAKNADIADCLGFAKLEGSPKQIAWAENLRIKMFEILKEKPYYKDVVESIAKSETSAKFYIDARDMMDIVVDKKYREGK
ncbi:hypothetical protein ACTQX5_09910 [Faecalicoccus sp. LCP19S3_E3]|uniref:hypothetical protein n=1 Tax=unclassified Faecalicoccus TaxID=2643311 RepID=UPI003F8DA92A